MQQYDKRFFTKAGFKFYDLYFPDGTCPPENILQTFLDIAESEPGALAVHCKAGLGRTGTLMCCFMMKHYGFTAEEVPPSPTSSALRLQTSIVCAAHCFSPPSANLFAD